MGADKKAFPMLGPVGNLEIENRIRQLLVSEMQFDPAVAGANHSSMPLLGRGIGLDSVETMALIIALEEEFNISVPDSDLKVDLFETIETLARYIAGKILEASQSTRWPDEPSGCC